MFDRIAAYRPDALYFAWDVVISGRQVAAFAAKQGLVSIATNGVYTVSEGGLLSYSAVFGSLLARAMPHVDRILRGARPGDLPVERPTDFALIVNTKVARAMGYAVPQSLLLRADRVIE